MIREDVIWLLARDGTERRVYCTVRSVGMREAYKAKEYGLSPSMVFVLSDFLEYQGEPRVRWGDRVFSIVRTYIAEHYAGADGYMSGRRIELTVQEVHSLYAPHTVTVYNVREDPASFETSVYITVLSGVLLEGQEGAQGGSNGLRPTGRATLKVPFDVDATDPEGGGARDWATPREYAAAADKSGLWTLDPNRDFFVKGYVVVPGGTFQELTKEHDGVYRVTSLEIRDTGAEESWHIAAGGA